MNDRDLVEWFDAEVGDDLRVVAGPHGEDLPDHLCVITRLPTTQITMEGAGEVRTFMSTVTPDGFNTEEGEDLAYRVDALWLSLARQTVGGSLIVWSDRVSGLAPLDIDDGERTAWQGSYQFEMMR